MIAERSGKDWTPEFNAYAAKRAEALTKLDLPVTFSRKRKTLLVAE